MTDQRVGVPSWDDTFMGIAEIVSKRSKDPNTQVGACIVSSDNRILSVGYNGAPKGFSDDVFPWGRTSTNPLENKHPFVVHSERNAILNFRGSLREFDRATIYVTHFPCNECAKEIAQVNISEVVFLNPHRASDGLSPASLLIFKHAGVNLRMLEEV